VILRVATEVAGWVGALTLVAAYYASSVGVIRPDARAYQGMNVVGSVGLGAVAWSHHTWPSLALNALWLLIATAALGRRPVPLSHPTTETKSKGAFQ
jgi:hypothetical protein